MEIIYHVGAHGTDQDRVIRTLMRNRDALWKLGVDIPAPNRYRGILGDAMKSLEGGEATPEVEEILLDSLLSGDRARRVLLSQSGFLGMSKRAVTPNGLYPNAADRMLGLSNLFPTRVVEFFLTLMHPATLAAHVVADNQGDYEAAIGSVDPLSLRWAPAIRNMLIANPDRDIVVWCQEDLPFIWPEVLRRMAGVEHATPLQGDDTVLSGLLPAAAMTELRAEIDAEAGQTVDARRTMTERFLKAHALDDAMVRDLSLPGWSQDVIDQISQNYAEDLAEIAALTGVEFISA